MINPCYILDHYKGVQKGRETLSMVVNGEQEYGVEAILRHKCKGSRHLYLGIWKGYPITKASWELKSHLLNAPLILEDYLYYIRDED